MQRWAGLGLLLFGLGGCAHLADGMNVDLDTGVVEVGSCRCKLPRAQQPAQSPVQDDEQPR